MQQRRSPWSLLFGAILLVAIGALCVVNWHTIRHAFELVRNARPGWLALGILAVVAGFVCAGQIYGRVLAIIGYRAPQYWLITTAMVSVLISQAIPAGTLGSYAFLTASLRRRGISGTSVALLASLELFTWIGGMLLMFCFGLLYKLLGLGYGAITPMSYTAATVALTMVGGVTFAITRPRLTLHRWVQALFGVLGQIIRRSWSEAHIHRIVEEIDAHRRLIVERPRHTITLICMQVLIFVLHGLALLMLLHALGASAPPLAVLAAYGLALIVSTFTALPGGGGTVEAALALSLSAEGVPPEAALGATILFRLFSFWLLLPIGAIYYRVLTAGQRQPLPNDQ